MAERQLPKLNVAGSIPVSRSSHSRTHKKAALLSAAFVCVQTSYFALAVCTFCSVGSV